MGREIQLAIIDGKEKRINCVGYLGLDHVLVALSRNPETIAQVEQFYQESRGDALYIFQKWKKYPGEITLAKIKDIWSQWLKGATDEQAVEFYQNLCRNPNPQFDTYKPDENVKDCEILELSEIIKQYEEKNPGYTIKDPETAKNLRRELAKDGIVIVDLRKKEIRYLVSPLLFSIKRERPTKEESEIPGIDTSVAKYSLPLEWRIVQE